MKRRSTRVWLTAGLAVAVSTGVLAATVFGQAPLPPQATRVQLEVEGFDVGNVSKLLGIESAIELVDREQEQEGPTFSRTVGRNKPIRVVLRRVVNATTGLHDWHNAARNGEPSSRRTATLTISNEDGRPVTRWQLINAWPSNYTVGISRTEDGEILVENVEITVDELVRRPPA